MNLNKIKRRVSEAVAADWTKKALPPEVCLGLSGRDSGLPGIKYLKKK